MIVSQAQFFALFGSPAGAIAGGPYLTATERRVLVALARHVRARVVIEFGVQEGETAAILMEHCPSITQYVGIDLPPGTVPALASQATEVPPEPGHLAAGRPQFRLIRQDSRTVRPEDLPVADMIWIDGGHDPETVLADTVLAMTCSNPAGAVIAWHDYNGVPEHGVRPMVDRMNGQEDRIVLVEGTWTCFRFLALPNPYRPDGTRPARLTPGGIVAAQSGDPAR